MIAQPPTPDAPPQAGNRPAIVLPACHIPVTRETWVEITVNGKLICASQVEPPKRKHWRHHR